MYEVFVSCADTKGVFVVTCLENGVVWYGGLKISRSCVCVCLWTSTFQVNDTCCVRVFVLRVGELVVPGV